MRNPLLRSIGVDQCSYLQNVVVTEADPDRAFYQEINQRLARVNDPRTIPNCIFLNAQNKLTIPTIVSPLETWEYQRRQSSDIDVIKEGGAVAASVYASAGVPELSRQAMTTQRAAILAALNATGQDFKRCGGVDLLQGSEGDAANNYFDEMDLFGAIVVRKGEVEYLAERGLAITGHGPPWALDLDVREDGRRPDIIRVCGTDGRRRLGLSWPHPILAPKFEPQGYTRLNRPNRPSVRFFAGKSKSAPIGAKFKTDLPPRQRIDAATLAERVELLERFVAWLTGHADRRAPDGGSVEMRLLRNLRTR